MNYLVRKAFDKTAKNSFSKLYLVRCFCESLEVRISDQQLRQAIDDSDKLLKLLVE